MTMRIIKQAVKQNAIALWVGVRGFEPVVLPWLGLFWLWWRRGGVPMRTGAWEGDGWGSCSGSAPRLWKGAERRDNSEGDKFVSFREADDEEEFAGGNTPTSRSLSSLLWLRSRVRTSYRHTQTHTHHTQTHRHITHIWQWRNEERNWKSKWEITWEITGILLFFFMWFVASEILLTSSSIPDMLCRDKMRGVEFAGVYLMHKYECKRKKKRKKNT